jgi:hypothetical protein
MQCPACGAAPGPGVSTSCDVCGRAFDPDATGVTAGGADAIDDEATRPSLTPTPVPRRSAAPPGRPHGSLEGGGSFAARYHIIKLLGMGGMGAVYQAWDAELEVALALKVIRPAERRYGCLRVTRGT